RRLSRPMRDYPGSASNPYNKQRDSAADKPALMRVKLTLEYDGANYSGWQLQSGQDSIQARVEAALAQLFSERVRVHGAGRTDAGVHALGQGAAFGPPRA